MTPRHTSRTLTLQDILPHLQRVRRLSDGSYLASCPVPSHGKGRGDLNPSLSLREENGRLLWYCHAGCSQEAVGCELERLACRSAQRTGRRLNLDAYARAKGLDAAKLRQWGLTDRQGGGIEIPYKDRNGNLVGEKYRDAGRRFRWRRGSTPILYGLWRWSEWQDTDTVYLCEGETDTLTLWHAGLPALGIPSASTWRAEWWREVEGFARIVVIPDNDAAGAGLVQRLAQTCPESIQERVQVLRLPEGVKDANELWLQVDADPERFREALAGCNIRAIVQTLRELHDCTIARNDSEDDRPLLMPLGELLADDAEHELEYIPLLGIEGLIARGTITLIGAHPKAGKTTFLIHACREWLRQGLKVVYLSEDSRAVWRERVKRFPELSALILNTIPRAHPENWARAVCEQEPDIVIVDTIRRFLPPKDENDAAAVSVALAPFVDLLQKCPRIAIVLVHHTRKNLHDGEITDVAGSHAFTAEVDAILLFEPVKGQSRQRILRPIAGRHWSLSPEPLVLELSEDTREYRVVGTTEEVLPETLAQSTQEKILHALRVLESATVDEIAAYLQEHREHIPKRTIHHHLAQLYTEGAVNREGRGTRAEPYTYSCNRAIVQPLNTLHDCTNSAPPSPDQPEPTPHDSTIARNGNQHETHTDSCYRATLNMQHDSTKYGRCRVCGGRMPNPSVEVCYYCRQAQPVPEPNPLSERTVPTWDTIDDWLQQASMPHDPLGLEPHEVDALRVLLAFAEARNFPQLTIREFGYTIRAGKEGWLNALLDIAGTPAVALATRML
jgi:DNA-binding transcriptional ArsR family regulator